MLTKTFLPSVFRGSTRNLDPWSGFGELGRVLADDWFAPLANYPAINVSSTDDETVVTADLPGFEPDDVELSVEGTTLKLRGTRAKGESDEGETFYRRERWSGSFERGVRLPFEAESGKVEAKFNKGELTVTLPRAESDRPKKIEVKAS
jgi:HSP20 family protein